jgi:hypothetical protein|nr:MAG TPA: hypothetical protein [Caudoviricetes sp.]
MTTYRLRDRKLQQKLDELSHGAFSEMMKTMGKFMATKSTTHVQLGESRFTVTLHKQDFEISPEYNPNAWNVYPDVTPPEGVWMRTEHRDETDPPGIFRKVGAVFQDGAWRNSTREAYPSHIRVKRFRPWE